MRFPLLIAGAFLCLSVPAFAAGCATIAGLADYMAGNSKGAAILEVVPINSAAIDNLVVYRAENGNIQVIGDFNGCLLTDPIVIDGPRQEPSAPTSTPRTNGKAGNVGA